MSLIAQVLLIVFIFLLFAVPHSVLAAFDVKKRLKERIGDKIAFYRLFYNISSTILFIAVYYISPKPQLKIYDLQFPYDILIFAFQFLGVVGFFWAGSYVDLKEFLGVKQVVRYYKDEYRKEDLDEYHDLIQKGPFKMSRHPIYFFSIVNLGFIPAMDLFYLVFFICITAYFFVGSIYEERSLEKRYGIDYVLYKENVPRIIPNPLLFFKKPDIPR